MIKSWMFYLFQGATPPAVDRFVPEDVQSTYDKYLEMVTANETQGFEGVFFSEHHFGGRNLTPSPHLLIAAASQRTTTLRLGVMGSVLPLHDVRRLAEECGMLDYITRGRLEIGIGPGAGPREYLLAGHSIEEQRPRYLSGAELLDKYIADAKVSHKDEFYNLDDLAIIPRMRQVKPNVWVTAMGEESYAWAAKRGHKVCTAWLPQPAVRNLSEVYRNAARAAGRPSGSAQLGLRRRVFVATTDAEAQDIADAAFDPILNATGAEARSFEASDDRIIPLLNQPDDMIVGSPKTVADQLIEQAKQGGIGHILFLTDFRMFGASDLARCHDLIARDIIPALRSASVD